MLLILSIALKFYKKKLYLILTSFLFIGKLYYLRKETYLLKNKRKLTLSIKCEQFKENYVSQNLYMQVKMKILFTIRYA